MNNEYEYKDALVVDGKVVIIERHKRNGDYRLQEV